MNESTTTRISSGGKSVSIAQNLPTVIIGERINPLGRRESAQAFLAEDMSLVKSEAIRQVEDGADVLDVNMATPGLDEEVVLPAVVKAVQETVDVPICLDTINPKALAAALAVYDGKALVNSVNAKEESLKVVLPVVKEYGAAVIGLTVDDNGIPEESAKRLTIAFRIVETAATYGIPKEDVLIDCLALSVGSIPRSGVVSLETIRLIKEELGVNMTLGVSNVSFGLPDRRSINTAFLSLVIAQGVTCPIVDVTVPEIRRAILATDVLLARDSYSARYLSYYRKTKKGK